MRLSGSDFPLLRRSILTVCASALIGATILYGSGEYAENARNDRHNAQNMLNNARGHLASALQDQNSTATYAGEYVTLVERKIIGDDQRLDWVEGLENIRRKNLVTGFRYSIAPQKAYTPQPPLDSGNFDIRYSEMKLQFDLLHEAQLPDFFAALRGGVSGWYQLEGCTLRRPTAATGEGNTIATAYLVAECSGGWITLKNRNIQ